MNEVVVCSLEDWDEVWRRNQFFVHRLLERDSELRVLFVEPSRRAGGRSSLRELRDGRLVLFRPGKPLPRSVGPWADIALRRSVLRAVRRVGFSDPTLWLNDTTYAALAGVFPTLYDITDDWLLAPVPARELARRSRLERIALERAREVVVCSPALAASRGVHRPVELVPNGVEVAHFRAPQARPADLPRSPLALYVGTQHDARIDIGLVEETAAALPDVRIVFVGPDVLSSGARARLALLPNVDLLGPRPYADIPAYLQHADVCIVPHHVTAFTDSLDPIKAYEARAVGRPVVATPVAGFRDLGPPVIVADRSSFPAAVAAALARRAPVLEPPPGIDWDDRFVEFERVLRRVSSSTPRAAAPRSRAS